MISMGDNIEYTLVLKSYPYTQDVLTDLNNNISYDVHVFFQNISSLHHCNLAKMELVGGVFIAQDGTQFTTAGIEIGVEIPFAKNTMFQTIIENSRIVAGSFNVNNFNMANGFCTLATSHTIYLENLSNISFMNIKLYDTLSGVKLQTQVDDTDPINPIYTEQPPAYMLTFKVTPIMNS